MLTPYNSVHRHPGEQRRCLSDQLLTAQQQTVASLWIISRPETGAHMPPWHRSVTLSPGALKARKPLLA